MNKIQKIIVMVFLINSATVIEKVSTVIPVVQDNYNKDEVNSLKALVKNLSGQIEKWNRLFSGSLEPRLSSTISIIASIDSNIHNLQERAHVWDTFQLHVTAWNDQLASLDRKADIINKGQEKLTTIENKLSLITNLEYKIDTIMKRLEKIEETIEESNKRVTPTENRSTNHDSLFGEFATRGILSTIKSIERKTDKLLLTNQNALLKTALNEEKPKLTIKCNTPKNIEELLNDMSSKIDVIFDKISDKDEHDDNNNNTDYDGDYFELQSDSSGEVPPDLKTENDTKLIKKLLKRLNQPCRKNNQILDELLSRTLRIENTTRIILDAENTNFEFLSNQHNYNTTERNIIKKIDDFGHQIQNKNSCECSTIYSNFNKTISKNNAYLNSVLESYFSEQKAHFESSLGKKFTTEYEILQNFPVTRETTELPETTTIYTVLTTPTLVNTKNEPAISNKNNETLELNKTSCEDLDHEKTSGVFIFNKSSEIESISDRFNKRFCEIRNDGLWTVIQRRDNYKNLENFTKNWEKYKSGFGNLMEDFWFGNENLFILSNKNDLILRVELEDFEGNLVWAEYSTFKVMSELDKYRLIIDGYTGNATDSLITHNNSFFSTFDRKNDEAPACCPCAVSYGGGWWFNRCFESNLNGVYYRSPNENEYFRGIIWEHWLGNYSLKKTLMMVKSKGKINFSTPSAERNETIIPFYEEP